MDKQKALEKVKAILAIANDSRANEEEAKTAALMAQSLMAKYDISDDDICDVEERKQLEQIVNLILNTNKNRNYRFALAGVIATNYRCEYYLNSTTKRLHFIGKKIDAEIAQQIFEYLYEVINVLSLKEYHKKKAAHMDLTGVMPSYQRGFIIGLKAALEKQTKELMIVTAVEVKDELQRICNGKTTDTSRKQNYNAHSFQKGYEEGRDFYEKKRIAEGVNK